MTKWIDLLLDVTGATLIVIGVAHISEAAAYIVAGLLVLAVSYLEGWKS